MPVTQRAVHPSAAAARRGRPFRPAPRALPGLLPGLFAALLFCLAASPAAAQAPDTGLPLPGQPVRRQPKPPPVNMVVQAGHAGFVRAGETAPIRVVMDNNDKALTGRLELRGPGGQVTQMPVELPWKAHKEYTFYAKLAPTEEHEVRLVEGSRHVTGVRWTPKTLEQQILVISATGDGSGLQFLHGKNVDPEQDPGPEEGGLRLARPEGLIQVEHAATQDLPRQWPGYNPATVVVLNGRAWTQMDDEQKRSLRTWIERGGRAILCGEATTEWRDPDGQSVAGVLPTDLRSPRVLEAVRGWAGEDYRAQAGALLTVSGALHPGSKVLAWEGTRPMIVSREAMLGRVLWLGFDPFRETFRAWPKRDLFCRRMIDAARAPLAPPQVSALDEVEQARAAGSALPRLPAPPLAAIVGFGVVYGAIFGPINVWMLRRMRRTVRAWLFMPILSVVMAAVVLLVGQSWGKGRTVLNSLSVLETAAGARSAREQTLLGLFSPTNRSFDLKFEDPAPEFRDLGSPDAQAAQVREPTVEFGWPDHQADGVVRWDAVALQLFSTRLLGEVRSRELGGSLEVRLRPDRSGTVRNGTALSLKDAYLVHHGSYYVLGDIAPGASSPVRAQGWTGELDRELSDPGPSVKLLENRKFRDALGALWRDARTTLVTETSRGEAWLVAECAGLPSGIEVAEVPYSNHAALLLVRVPGSGGTQVSRNPGRAAGGAP